MRGPVLNLLTVLSLIVCVFALALSLLSYGWHPEVQWGGASDSGFGWPLRDHKLSVYAGRLYYTRSRGPMVTLTAPPTPNEFALLGVRVTQGYWQMVPDSDSTAFRRVVAVPFYWPVLGTIILPVLQLRRELRRRRLASQAQCLTCGYDLRATPDRCPECGTPAATEANPVVPSPAAR